MAEQVSVMVEGGRANPGPPLGPALGPLGLNVGQVVAQINEKTKVFDGMKVPVIIKVGANRSFTLEVGHPPTAAMLLKEAKKEKGSGKAKHDSIGSVSMATVKKIAEAKAEDLFGNTMDAKINQVLGTCVSMGLLVDGASARDLLRERKGA
ncbi:MAG: 50S ribosomal protein L11 [Candidatus Thermoplasmatota archaeon]|jgi:large subunit ribosomal protein L11|nr:50S ribosomal protein L11 [Candidatus Thermoplasmatota archaeon]MCL5984344.1 50S ribosomal protein L11 [Candidatus Thermoplasmatota archaeon]